MGKAKKEIARQHRLEAERREQLARTQQRARRRMLGLGLACLIGLAILIGAILLSSHSAHKVTSASSVAGTSPVASLLAGLPDHDRTLGTQTAKVQIHEYADLQCPICKAFSDSQLQSVLNDDVRTDRATLTYEPFAILGDDSVTAARAMLAASAQNKAWPFIELWYANQQEENSGYVTSTFINSIAKAAGLNMTEFDHDLTANKASYEQTVTATQQAAVALGFQGTPSISIVGPKGTTKFTNPTAQTIDDAVKAQLS